MTLAEFSKATGFSLDDLKRFRTEGMLRPVGAGRHADYTEQDVERVRLLRDLRALRIPLWKVAVTLRVLFDGDRDLRNMQVAHSVAAEAKAMAATAKQVAQRVWSLGR